MLPFFKSAVKELEMLQTKWASILNPIVDAPLSQSVQLDGVVLTAGNNLINHRLGRQPQGWEIVDTTAAATIYRTSWDNLTLALNSSANTTVSIRIY